MIAVTGKEAVIAELIQPYFAECSIAAVDGPAQVVVSGQRVGRSPRGRVSRGRDVNLGAPRFHAFHSP